MGLGTVKTLVRKVIYGASALVNCPIPILIFQNLDKCVSVKIGNQGKGHMGFC